MRKDHHPTHQNAPTGVDRPEEAMRVLERVETRGIRFINLEFTDVVGLAKSVTISADQLAECVAQGKWFDGSAIEGFARVAETDMYLRPDLSTFTEIPWSPSNGQAEASGPFARVICDVLTPSGERFEGDPRAVLVRAVEVVASLGYRYEAAAELEFFLLAPREGDAPAPLPHDRGGYFDLSTDLASEVRREIAATLAHMGITIEASHHEATAGQHELDFAATDALRAADALVTARYAVKAIAQRHGLWATFMPKPFYGIAGSGLHIHQRLIRLADNRNAFADPHDVRYGLDPLARQFIAGQLAHAPAMCAVLCPLVNSYKRLGGGFEAPLMINWGRVNREALIRVPRATSAPAPDTRVELRCADPSCNPYLALAVMLYAGLDGIKGEFPVPPPVEESLYAHDESSRLLRQVGALPATLSDALDALRGDGVVRDALGELIAEWFIDAKSREWHEYQRQVHAWELERYLPMF